MKKRDILVAAALAAGIGIVAEQAINTSDTQDKSMRSAEKN